MATVDIKVPDIGDFTDVDVIEVMVKPGDHVGVEQSLITIESDKATMEVPSPQAGIVKELKVHLGDKVSEGSPIVEPSETLSPRCTFSSLTIPACGDGTSIVALSDSIVMSDCSTPT